MDYDIYSNALTDRLQQDMTRRRKLVKKLKNIQEQELEVTSRPSNRHTNRDYYAPERNSFSRLPPLQLAMSPSLPVQLVTQPATPAPVSLVPLQSPSRDSGRMTSHIMDMMMLQNAQLSQVVMHRMALSTIQPEPSTTMRPSRTGTRINISIDELLSQLKRRDDDYDDPYSRTPIQMLPTPTMLFYEAQPLRVPKVMQRRKRSPLLAPVQRPKPIKRRLPYPLTGPLKRFRRVALAVLFTVFLDHQKRRNENNPRRVAPLNERFLFGIRLRESVSAIHRIFLNPNNRIFGMLRKVIDGRMQDLTVALRTDGTSLDHHNVINELSIIMENTINEITEIMPKTGVLGTQRKSTTYKMIQPEMVYPKGYFWQIEKDLLGVDSKESLRSVSDSDASCLLIGHFLGRGLIASLLLKPREFRLVASSESVQHGADRNLRFLASLFFYLLRKVYTNLKTTNDIVNRPTEYDHLLHDDKELATTIEHLSKSFQYAEELLTSWAQEFIRRLRRIR